jgi:formylglycine-generating enzyme required for sulfatase activity
MAVATIVAVSILEVEAADPAVPTPIHRSISSPSFTNYSETIPGSTVTLEMVAIAGGEILLGSPEGQVGRGTNDVALQKVTGPSFWMGKFEIEWQQFYPWVFADRAEVEADRADGVSHPTRPYGSPYRDRGEKGYPAIGMSQRAAVQFCKWLSKKTGHEYRLPTEAEWEYACRSGRTTAYFWGDDPGQAGEYGWFKENSKLTTQPVGKKRPNPFGLYDMVGNVGEWCAKEAPGAPSVLRGGSYEDVVTGLRCAARVFESLDWNAQDPKNPPSIYWLSAADFVGFRVVRSLDAVKK